MMKKNLLIWMTFGLCLAIVLPAMIWLSLKINEIDRERETDQRQTELARREAELQERINSALYRMDWMLTPLIAQEAARPYYLYQPFYRAATVNPSASRGTSQNWINAAEPVQQPSPLLLQPSDFVKLHFQLDPNNNFSSPQTPLWLECQNNVMTCNTMTPQKIESKKETLELAQSFCDFQSLQYLCPSVRGDQVDDRLASTETVYSDPSFNDLLGAASPQQLVEEMSPPFPVEAGKTKQQQVRNAMRASAEFAQRIKGSQAYANEWAKNSNPQMAQQVQQSDLKVAPQPPMVREGMMRPIWVDKHLLLARLVASDDQQVIQCCWLNWELIKETLKAEVEDILPEVEFRQSVASDSANLSRTLATLPVQLVVDSNQILGSLAIDGDGQRHPISGLQWALIVAWVGLAAAAISTALLLSGVMRLSERRAAFVSAVTHELRTPLTTFRMYAEMLAEKMVPTDKQTSYAETLKSEADRLSHLVENVLQFARLEEGQRDRRLERVSLGQLFDQFQQRLRQRTEDAGMELLLDIEACREMTVETDPARVEQIVFNMIDNACKYACMGDDRRLLVSCSAESRLQIGVRDFGPGVDSKFRKTLFEPFCKSDQDAANTAPGVGLGLALCRRMAKSIGGRIYHQPTDVGALFVLELPLNG